MRKVNKCGKGIRNAGKSIIKHQTVMSFQDKILDKESIGRAAHAVLVYAKGDKIKVMHIEQANVEINALVADGWHHTATMDAAMFIENLCNVEMPNGAVIDEIRKLTMTEKQKQELLEISAPIELFPSNGKAVEITTEKVGPPKVSMTVPGTRKDWIVFEALIDRVLEYKIQGNVQMPFTGELISYFTPGPSHEEMIYETERPGYDAVMDYYLTFKIQE